MARRCPIAFPSVTYTFSNGTASDASQVNQCFTDIINALSDGTKDISVNAGTFAGNVSISGNTTLGNASSDDVTVTGSLASSIPIKTTNSYDIGSSSLGLRALYFGANSQTVNIKGSASMSATWTLTLPVNAGSAGNALRTDGAGVTRWATSLPVVTRYTTGSGNHTTSANCVLMRVRMVAGGGGGAGSGTSGGGNGGNGTGAAFGTLTCFGGSGGNAAGAGGAGGVIPTDSGSWTIAYSAVGGVGGGTGQGAANVYIPGGYGGDAAYFAGGGGKSAAVTAAGAAGIANTGGGGQGGGSNGTAATNTGGGGGSGSYIEAYIIPTASQVFAYSVGAGGTAGTAGVNGLAGGAGGSSMIIVEEFF